MTIDKVSLTVFASVPIGIALYLAFLWVTYIDESIYEGSGYGFFIGETKSQVYERVKRIHEERTFVTLMVVGDPKRPIIFRPFQPSSQNFNEIEKYDYWKLSFKHEVNSYDSISLRFFDKQLERIHRHRKYFDTL